MNTTTLPLEKQLDLRKDIVLNLKKSKGIEGLKAQVVLALDYSGSMYTLYQMGAVQLLVEKLLPLGLAFDDNGEVDFYLFHDGFIKMNENITLRNVAGYVNNKIINRYEMGGTDYSVVINKIVEDFSNSTTTTSGGFLGLGGSKTKSFKKLDMPVYVIFITDGNTSNQSRCEEAIREAAKAGIFFQFVGIGNEQFTFLQKLDNLSGRVIDNANFFKVQDINTYSDEQLYDMLLNEFPGFIPQAKAKGLIV